MFTDPFTTQANNNRGEIQVHQRNQGHTETVLEYLTALRRAAAECKFEGFLEEALRDRFVCGLSSESLRRRLF